MDDEVTVNAGLRRKEETQTLYFRCSSQNGYIKKERKMWIVRTN